MSETKTLTEQEAFDKVCLHLAAQKTRARLKADLFDSGLVERCAYRGNAGSKCAVGCLIPDEAYTRAFEGMPLSEIMEQVPTIKGLDLDFLVTLQAAHDGSLSLGSLKSALRNVAGKYDLNPHAINQIMEWTA